MLSGAATLGVITLAGCSGGDGDDGGSDGGDGGSDGDDGGSQSYQVSIGATSSGSSTMAAAQALQRAASEHSDILSVSAQTTSGWTANIREFANGNISAMGVDNNSLSKAMNDAGPFEGNRSVDNLPMQGFVFTNLEIYWVAMEGSDIESTADLADGGHTIYPIQPGFGTRLLTEEVLKEAGVWEPNDILNADTSDIPGNVEEGNVDALCVYGANGVDLSGWVQNVDVRSGDSLQIIDVDENFANAIENVGGAIKKEIEPYGWEQDVTGITDTTTGWVLAGQWAFGPSVPAEATHEIARISSEHADAIREADSTALDHSDPESMTTAVIPELEVHPGVADFFEENDVWNDEWMRGETN